MFGTYPETLWHLTGTVVLELLDDLVVAAQIDPLFTSAKRRAHTHTHTVNAGDGKTKPALYLQALVGRELVKRQVLRAPAGVGAFVETTVHVRRHGVWRVDGGGSTDAGGSRRGDGDANGFTVGGRRGRLAVQKRARTNCYADAVARRVQNWINFLKLKRCSTLITTGLRDNALLYWRHRTTRRCTFSSSPVLDACKLWIPIQYTSYIQLQLAGTIRFYFIITRDFIRVHVYTMQRTNQENNVTHQIKNNVHAVFVLWAAVCARVRNIQDELRFFTGFTRAVALYARLTTAAEDGGHCKTTCGVRNEYIIQCESWQMLCTVKVCRTARGSAIIWYFGGRRLKKIRHHRDRHHRVKKTPSQFTLDGSNTA